MRRRLVVTTTPDLSEYSVIDDVGYEWFLSDHPWAVAERTRRRTAKIERELHDAAKAGECAYPA
jgi:hypothetical protein